ncbi:MAG: phosphatidate cytidylyltransferase [Candidatus Eisenbacteria bacterium]|nr:phosphatidate cytidylyltransferase [Candidatus Eisenbacteria bacterium]
MRYSSELGRKAIHVSSLAFPIALHFLPVSVSKPALVALTLVTLLVDALRLHEPHVRRVFYFLFGRLLREHERFNLLGSTYMLIAALISIAAFPQAVAVIVLAFLVIGDTVAALVGKRWGKTKILDKSLEGSIGCFLSCVAVGTLYHFINPELGWARIVVGSFVATIFELAPVPMDDNLRIPLSAGFAMTLLP